MTGYPEHCIQTLFYPDWWIAEKDTDSPVRGSLILTFVPFIEHVPFCVVPVGRKEATQHGEAIIKVDKLNIGSPPKIANLPVAALPVNRGENYMLSRAKIRPCLVLGYPTPEVPDDQKRGMAAYTNANTLLVAPYYGATPTKDRKGYPQEFVNNVQRCGYPQFFWDDLPGGEPSILRLDQIHPIGAHSMTYKKTGYRLSDDALSYVMDEYLSWLMFGRISSGGLLESYLDDMHGKT